MEAREMIAVLMGHGYTQEQISARTGLLQPTISKIVRGQVKDVLSRTYIKLDALYKEVVTRAAELERR